MAIVAMAIVTLATATAMVTAATAIMTPTTAMVTATACRDRRHPYHRHLCRPASYTDNFAFGFDKLGIQAGVQH